MILSIQNSPFDRSIEHSNMHCLVVHGVKLLKVSAAPLRQHFGLKLHQFDAEVHQELGLLCA